VTSAEEAAVAWSHSVHPDLLLPGMAILILSFAIPVPAQLGFGPPEALNSNAGSDSRDDLPPDICTDGTGNWVVVWDSTENLGGTIGTDLDILVSRSSDNGGTWSPPAALNSNAGSDSGHDYPPAISTDGAGNWVVVWYSVENLGGIIGVDLDILVARSSDNGATWSPPAALNSNAASDSGGDYHPALSTDGAGNWVAVWYSLETFGGTIGSDYDILVSRSSDNGATWSPPAALNSNASSDIGRDYYPAVNTDRAGSWMVAWESNENLSGVIGTDEDILVARSSDNGATWSPPAALNSNAASDSGGDYRATISTNGAGNWVVVWDSHENLGGTIGSDFDIFVSRSDDSGTTWSTPATLNSNAGSDSGWDRHPAIGTDDLGNWVVAWYTDENLGGTIGTDLDILVSRSSDNGGTWSPPAALNSNAGSDAGDDYDPVISSDKAGNWVVVWDSNENLGGAIGTDYDILVSTSSSVPVELMAFSVD
jgi:Neuraminidase (sialidase)